MANSTRVSPYHLGFFVKPGKPSKSKDIDIVATKWISPHPSNRSAVHVKYPPPPYTQESQQDFNNRLKNLEDAPASWNDYTFKIRGRADTFDEALRKLEELKTEDHILTVGSDDENDAEQLGAEVVKQLKRQKLIEQSENMKAARLSYKNQKSQSSKFTETSLSSAATEESLANQSLLSGTETVQSKKKLPQRPTNTLVSKPNNQTIISHNSHYILEKGKRQKDIQVPGPSGMSSGLSNHNNDTTTKKQATKRKASGQRTLLALLLECIIQQKSDIDALKEDVSIIKSQQSQILMMLGKGTRNTNAFVGTAKQLAQKYNLVIPFTTLQQFKDFDNQLGTDESCLEDVKSVLQTAIHPNLCIPRSIVSMLRLFLQKEVAMKYTAVKPSKEKGEVMRSTNFFAAIEELITERRSIYNFTTTEKEVNNALGKVLCNAVHWKTSYQTSESCNNSNDSQTIELDGYVVPDPQSDPLQEPGADCNIKILATCPLSPGESKRSKLDISSNFSNDDMHDSNDEYDEVDDESLEEYDEDYLQQLFHK